MKVNEWHFQNKEFRNDSKFNEFVGKGMNVNEHERPYNFTLRHKLR
jgi:hypothetical protein